jgi:hypothetical protein
MFPARDPRSTAFRALWLLVFCAFLALLGASDTSLSGGGQQIVALGTPGAPQGQGGAGGLTIGGSVSGLSGTVVLQDNDADDLSVSADGPFRFRASLPAGSGYAITVRANPSGEACTVARGAGTVATADVGDVAVACTASPASPASDGPFDAFNRVSGPPGPDWAAVSGGGMTISAAVVAGTNATGVSGDSWRGGPVVSNQFSQIELTSTKLSGNQWIGAAVRVQDDGLDAYVGMYFWDNGNPEMMLFRRGAAGWSQLGDVYNCGPLPAGTQLRLMVVGSTVAFEENGVQRIAAGDTTLVGGAPGVMAFGTATADDWSGGRAGFAINYLSTDANGVRFYDVISADNGPGPQVMRVLPPTKPAPGVPQSFLYVLPVEAGLGNSFGDGLKVLRDLDAQDKYNLTIIEPTFAIDPWYADNPRDSDVTYDTFMADELVPWAQKHLAKTGHEQNWLIGFSKSGFGAQDLLLRHPHVFTLAASWDFPAGMATYSQLGPDPAAAYGTNANFQRNYRLTPSFVSGHKAPFRNSNRIWIGGYSLYQPDVIYYGSLLTSEGIAHSTEPPQYMLHSWDSGWVPLALAALHRDSEHLRHRRL